MRIVAFDPGEAHFGRAELEVRDNEFAANTAVFDVKRTGWVNVVDRAVPDSTLPYIVVCESYRARPVGFNAFGDGKTLQIIGAAHFASVRRGHRWAEVPAGDPSQLDKLVLGSYVDKWRSSWPNRGHRDWQHACSAWRVLAHFLLQYHSEMLLKLRSPKVLKTFHTRGFGTGVGGLQAPTAFWSTV